MPCKCAKCVRKLYMKNYYMDGTSFAYIKFVEFILKWSRWVFFLFFNNTTDENLMKTIIMSTWTLMHIFRMARTRSTVIRKHGNVSLNQFFLENAMIIGKSFVYSFDYVWRYFHGFDVCVFLLWNDNSVSITLNWNSSLEFFQENQIKIPSTSSDSEIISSISSSSYQDSRYGPINNDVH